MSDMDKNYEFYMKKNLYDYLGKWIAICDKRIVSQGMSVKAVIDEAKTKCPNPLVTRVTDKQTMIF
jgi:hypothetical protein